MKCPHCNRNEMNIYYATDILSGKEKAMCKCFVCGYFAITNEGSHEFEKSNYYTLDFTTVSGDKGKFIGTKEEIHKNVDDYLWLGFNNMVKENRLRIEANYIEILKYGYSNEFKNDDYSKYEITVDNSLWMKISIGIW